MSNIDGLNSTKGSSVKVESLQATKKLILAQMRAYIDYGNFY